MMSELVYIFLFLIGFIEEFVAIVYYGFIRKGWKIPCASMSMFRNIIWLLAGAGIFSSFLSPQSLEANLRESVVRGLIHTMGVGVGNYLSLCMEKTLHDRILKLQRRRRKKKWWFFSGDRKK